MHCQQRNTLSVAKNFLSMKNLQFSYLLAFFVVTALFTACNDDDVQVPEEPEVITDVNLVLTPEGGGATVVFSFNDPDGEGGVEGTAIGGTLSVNTMYTGAITLTNASDINDIEDITEEIAEEDEEHQFFFDVTDANITVAYNDMDEDGNPIGLLTTVTTGNASTGTFTVILRHEPDKGAEGVSDGNIANAGGETDIEVEFPVTVQ